MNDQTTPVILAVQPSTVPSTLASTVNPDKVAITITGIFVSSASLIVIAASHLGFPVTVEQVATFAGELGTAVGAIVTVWGVIQKIVVAIERKRQGL